MPEKPHRKTPASKSIGSTHAEAPEEMAEIYKTLDSDLVFRSLATALPSTSALADAFKGMGSTSRLWADIASLLDWTKSARLQSEALRALNISTTIQRQKEALRTVNLDVDRPRDILPSSTQKSESEKEVDNGRESEIRRRTEEIEIQSGKLTEGEVERSRLQQLITERDDNIAKLQPKPSLAFLLHRIHPAAQSLVKADNSFRDSFEAKDCWGFVVSVDIRRSTELMPRTRKPEQHAKFVSQLTCQLTKEVLASFGVLDKFTGDGILAFFPDFYSGKDAGFHAASAALRCHQIFQHHDREHRSSLSRSFKILALELGLTMENFSLYRLPVRSRWSGLLSSTHAAQEGLQQHRHRSINQRMKN